MNQRITRRRGKCVLLCDLSCDLDWQLAIETSETAPSRAPPVYPVHGRSPNKQWLCAGVFFRGLLHNSQSFFQAIFYLYLDFLFISYTRTKKVMFRALMTPRITSFQKDTASRVYIFNSYKRVLLKELFFLFVILKAFLARQKRAR